MNKKYTLVEIQEQLKQILISKTGVKEENIFPESVFHIEMGLDSLDIAEIFYFVEDHFAITFKTTDEEKIDNFQKLIDMTQKYLIKQGEF